MKNLKSVKQKNYPTLLEETSVIEQAAIHPTAIIEAGAKIGENVIIGPYCSVGANVTLADDVTLVSHVAIAGRTSIGKGTKIYPFASIGHAPQDQKYHGEPSTLTIGENNTIREYVTIQPGTEGGGMATSVGNNCLFMVSAHIAHDCQVGNHVILANNVALGGHVIVEDHAIIGGLSGIHQFVRIGAHAMIGGMSGVDQDVIPYGLVGGERARLNGLNLVGLKRRGFSTEAIQALRESYRKIFISGQQTLLERIEEVAKTFSDNEIVMELIEFIQTESSRSLCMPRNSD